MSLQATQQALTLVSRLEWAGKPELEVLCLTEKKMKEKLVVPCRVFVLKLKGMFTHLGNRRLTHSGRLGLQD